jgi:hypothetical protein
MCQGQYVPQQADHGAEGLRVAGPGDDELPVPGADLGENFPQRGLLAGEPLGQPVLRQPLLVALLFAELRGDLAEDPRPNTELSNR